jgi:hypothetical protein
MKRQREPSSSSFSSSPTSANRETPIYDNNFLIKTEETFEAVVVFCEFVKNNTISKKITIEYAEFHPGRKNNNNNNNDNKERTYTPLDDPNSYIRANNVIKEGKSLDIHIKGNTAFSLLSNQTNDNILLLFKNDTLFFKDQWVSPIFEMCVLSCLCTTDKEIANIWRLDKGRSTALFYMIYYLDVFLEWCKTNIDSKDTICFWKKINTPSFVPNLMRFEACMNIVNCLCSLPLKNFLKFQTTTQTAYEDMEKQYATWKEEGGSEDEEEEEEENGFLSYSLSLNLFQSNGDIKRANLDFAILKLDWKKTMTTQTHYYETIPDTLSLCCNLERNEKEDASFLLSRTTRVHKITEKEMILCFKNKTPNLCIELTLPKKYDPLIGIMMEKKKEKSFQNYNATTRLLDSPFFLKRVNFFAQLIRYGHACKYLTETATKELLRIPHNPIEEFATFHGLKIHAGWNSYTDLSKYNTKYNSVERYAKSMQTTNNNIRNEDAPTNSENKITLHNEYLAGPGGIHVPVQFTNTVYNLCVRDFKLNSKKLVLSPHVDFQPWVNRVYNGPNPTQSGGVPDLTTDQFIDLFLALGDAEAYHKEKEKEEEEEEALKNNNKEQTLKGSSIEIEKYLYTLCKLLKGICSEEDENNASSKLALSWKVSQEAVYFRGSYEQQTSSVSAPWFFFDGYNEEVLILNYNLGRVPYKAPNEPNPILRESKTSKIHFPPLDLGLNTPNPPTGSSLYGLHMALTLMFFAEITACDSIAWKAGQQQPVSFPGLFGGELSIVPEKNLLKIVTDYDNEDDYDKKAKRNIKSWKKTTTAYFSTKNVSDYHNSTLLAIACRKLLLTHPRKLDFSWIYNTALPTDLEMMEEIAKNQMYSDELERIYLCCLSIPFKHTMVFKRLKKVTSKTVREEEEEEDERKTRDLLGETMFVSLMVVNQYADKNIKDKTSIFKKAIMFCPFQKLRKKVPKLYPYSLAFLDKSDVEEIFFQSLWIGSIKQF